MTIKGTFVLSVLPLLRGSCWLNPFTSALWPSGTSHWWPHVVICYESLLEGLQIGPERQWCKAKRIRTGHSNYEQREPWSEPSQAKLVLTPVWIDIQFFGLLANLSVTEKAFVFGFSVWKLVGLLSRYLSVCMQKDMSKWLIFICDFYPQTSQKSQNRYPKNMVKFILFGGHFSFYGIFPTFMLMYTKFWCGNMCHKAMFEYFFPGTEVSQEVGCHFYWHFYSEGTKDTSHVVIDFTSMARTIGKPHAMIEYKVNVWEAVWSWNLPHGVSKVSIVDGMTTKKTSNVLTCFYHSTDP